MNAYWHVFMKSDFLLVQANLYHIETNCITAETTQDKSERLWYSQVLLQPNRSSWQSWILQMNHLNCSGCRCTKHSTCVLSADLYLILLSPAVKRESRFSWSSRSAGRIETATHQFGIVSGTWAHRQTINKHNRLKIEMNRFSQNNMSKWLTNQRYCSAWERKKLGKNRSSIWKAKIHISLGPRTWETLLYFLMFKWRCNTCYIS